MWAFPDFPSLPWWYLVDCTKLHPRQTLRQNTLRASPGQHDLATSSIILDSCNLAIARMNNYTTQHQLEVYLKQASSTVLSVEVSLQAYSSLVMY
jgi:hypothetical protein